MAQQRVESWVGEREEPAGYVSTSENACASEHFSKKEQKKTVHKLRTVFQFMSLLSGSNQRPTDYKSVALPAELKRLLPVRECKYKNLFFDCNR